MVSILWQSLPAKYLHWLLGGFAMTVALSLAVFLLGCALAAAWLALRRVPWRPVAIAANAVIGLLRKTPLLVQLFFWYFGAAQLLGDAAIGAISDWRGLQMCAVAIPAPSLEALASVFGIALYASAFYAQELEAGIAAVPRGQFAAALALGFAPRAAWWRIVLPQALRIAARPMVGQFCQTIKNTSLAMAIGFAELSYTARQVETDTLMAFQAFGIATLLYAALILSLQAVAPALLRRLGWTGARHA
ncbi:ABC-type transporter, permease component [Cupriavidus necator]|uniref:ABC-type transporter, permease component n=1 Tax=Cupriavidus necator (strain ATCC 17699 / DSM 428 / KCTC 22496 / NCIMB 10442 / H16 / Stanier 337) TaxID=381666 RepID=Q0JYA3_CUPNH|nr:ABC transporter permease subunit [Cupriavidus necator]QCC05033.1 amino acid ABC transporter permease [Cupriavidus necator H16]QQB79721.1 ABC transporter permease subunit [Cupriavidus necator]WKA43966.1 ABC transporter permease subunit [Cupriavidus necator]CAJ97271.1 ABC-type transporter, permease component [Cupriavidus necator H16]